MQDFRKLEAWQLARTLRVDVYRLTRRFPSEERYVLTPQIRRSASSIGWNLAEGTGRGTDPDFARFLNNALGSVSECLDQLIQALDLEYITREEFAELEEKLDHIGRKISRLIQYLRGKR